MVDMASFVLGLVTFIVVFILVAGLLLLIISKAVD